MPIEFNFKDAYICSADGKIEMKLADIKEFEATEDENEEIKPPIEINWNRSQTFECRCSTQTIRNLTKMMVYGWKARGPVRKRLIDKELRKVMINYTIKGIVKQLNKEE